MHEASDIDIIFSLSGGHMRELEFRDSLTARLGQRSIDSYVAYCRRVERELGIDLDSYDLTETGIASLERQLRASRINERSANNCLSAIRAYAEFAIRKPSKPSAKARMMVSPEQRQAWTDNTADGPFNMWLNEQVKDAAGRLDLERLYEVARQYGVNRDYAHLNAGQQRMNIGNLLRRLVPRSLYEKHEKLSPLSEDVRPPSSTEPAPHREGLQETSVSDLLKLYGGIMDELRARQVIRTGNAPVGDYAELLFAKAFGWELEGNSASGHDAVDPSGARYQIKGRRLGSPTASRQLSAIRRLDQHTFDYLAAVLFDPNFEVLRAILIPHGIVAARARRTEHTNSWTFILDDRVWQVTGVRDVTAEVAFAVSQI